MADIRYSICATHYNNVDQIRDSVGVFADEIADRDRWELVVTDAGSDDGSLEYLQELASNRDDIRVIVEKGINIGEGRRLAANAARGEILIQVMDLDAGYYQDGRLIDTTAFYESLLEKEGEVMLSAGVNFCTKQLLNELGGWNDLIANEETELKRRALRHDKLRFCPIRMFDRNAGKGKGLFDAVKRFYYNSAAKFQAGVGFWHSLRFWLKYAPGLKPKLGALVVFPFAWVRARWSGKQIESSYERDDEYLMGFKRTVYERHPELWIDPPDSLATYADDTEVVNK